MFLEINDWSSKLLTKINEAENYVPCKSENCSCFVEVIDLDLKPFQNGITEHQFEEACSKATKYQVSQKII